MGSVLIMGGTVCAAEVMGVNNPKSPRTYG